jgi:LDH2 family malate/lactate/ureidoglycolate dehydrogenase
MSTAAEQRMVTIEALRQAMGAVLERRDVPSHDAASIVDVLLDSELRGYDDHGVWFLKSMVGWYADGLNPTPQVRVVRESTTTLVLDGDHGCGVLAATEAMQRCIAKARAHGMACAQVRNSGNPIAMAPFVLLAAEAGQIGYAASHVPPLMVPTGSATRTFGTNPFAYAVPAGKHLPLLLDMSTSATAAAKVMLAAQEGRPVAPGLLQDPEGRETQDPTAFGRGGALLPVGGPKGSGLAMLVDVLCGVLSGNPFPFAREMNGPLAPRGHFLWALDVESFLPREEFLARMDAQIDQVKSGTPQQGVEEIFVPGERGLRRKRQLLSQGTVPLSAASWEALSEVCRSAGIPLPPVLNTA